MFLGAPEEPLIPKIKGPEAPGVIQELLALLGPMVTMESWAELVMAAAAVGLHEQPGMVASAVTVDILLVVAAVAAGLCKLLEQVARVVLAEQVKL
jgi:hypothetical protein